MIAQLTERLPRVKLFSMYGLTECTRISILPPAELGIAPDTVGRPIDGTLVALVGPDGRPVAKDGVGELIVSGPHVALGYWRAEKATARQFRTDAHGRRWLHTGDTCQLDPAGRIRVIGRSDGLIKRHGFRMSLLELERSAAAWPGVLEAGATVDPAGDVLHLVLRTSGSLDTTSFTAALSAALGPHKLPDRIHCVADFPRTLTGKLDRGSLLRVVQAFAGPGGAAE
jgi:acyl-coenzyme A synthetase/AMP-(fatty) acid ligase